MMELMSHLPSQERDDKRNLLLKSLLLVGIVNISSCHSVCTNGTTMDISINMLCSNGNALLRMVFPHIGGGHLVLPSLEKISEFEVYDISFINK